MTPDPSPGEPQTPSDAELLARSAQGDPSAFEQFCLRHAPRIRGLFRRMGHNPAVADDLAQLTFLRAWKAAGRYRGEPSAVPWILTIARRIALNESSKQTRHPSLSLDSPASDQDRAALHDSRQHPPLEHIARKELFQALQTALAELPAQQSLALALHRGEGLSHEKIASILQTSVPAVKSLIFRARSTLRQKLKKFLEN